MHANLSRGISIEVINNVYPNKEQIQGFLELGAEGAICMVNLLKFKINAEFEDGRETDLTGIAGHWLEGKLQ
ncbi:MAG: hypothetical protein V7754_08930 [Halioglobus sp.]